MTGIEIVLCVIGIIAVLATFIFSDFMGEEGTNNIDKAIIDSTTREIVEKEVEGQLAEVIDEKMENAEAGLDKILNEKMLALGSYSETVMEDINKNHMEVMFLYNMLGEKEDTLKDTIRDIEALKVSIKQMAVVNDFAKATADRIQKDNASKMSGKVKIQSSNKDSNPEEMVQEKVSSEEFDLGQLLEEEPKVDSNAKDVSKVIFDDEKTNNNQKILELYKKGMTNIEIAKELGLGIGEVKLVIGLFKDGN